MDDVHRPTGDVASFCCSRSFWRAESLKSVQWSQLWYHSICLIIYFSHHNCGIYHRTIAPSWWRGRHHRSHDNLQQDPAETNHVARCETALSILRKMPCILWVYCAHAHVYMYYVVIVPVVWKRINDDYVNTNQESYCFVEGWIFEISLATTTVRGGQNYCGELVVSYA